MPWLRIWDLLPGLGSNSTGKTISNRSSSSNISAYNMMKISSSKAHSTLIIISSSSGGSGHVLTPSLQCVALCTMHAWRC